MALDQICFVHTDSLLLKDDDYKYAAKCIT